MEQTKALNALEPFLALSKTATSPRAASDLVTQATSAPNTFVFAELILTPNIQKLRESEHASYLTLLEIFAWGTWEDYKGRSDLPKLSDKQHEKLLMLSLLPLARSHSTLTYPALMSALDLSTPRALEQLLTTAIYAGLLTATLDPAHSVVSVTSVAPLRDLAPGSLPALQATLANWSNRCGSALEDLELRVAEVRKAAVEREMLRRKKERALEVMLQLSEDKGKGGGQRRDEGYEDMMDVDEQGGSGRQTRGMKRGFAGGFSGLGKRLG
ncbi:uncharacterized protein N0V89_002916 [Didymosphaeria variabile]|uniref:PCI domain-containing protein n=1 Tax=Didymosphaeria variabile TaxID=1932322 RepID=A0A9W8XTK4_9PLEO|nr:uncharacterized protein N0V89_002916 [Didymosphaeria variabile]KAJ4358334.1 hypothetical protein N0V89_002916 [Didymosphaeria variabile]